MLNTFCVAGVTSLHTQGRSPTVTCFAAWQQASEGRTLGPGIRTNWEHLDTREVTVSLHEAATFWLPRIWIPTINNIAKANPWRWVLVVAISFTRYICPWLLEARVDLEYCLWVVTYLIQKTVLNRWGVVLALITSVLQFKVLMQESKKKRN
jgi:hypothetical protein